MYGSCNLKSKIKMARKFEVSYVDRCVVIKMAWGENRLNPDFLSAMHNALDKAERYCTAELVLAGLILGLDTNYF